jgi:hypothetical protein
VVRGTQISSFDVQVLDVIAPQAGLTDARILVRVSGPAVDATGVGPGFSGSPILCPDGAGVRRNIGAISEGIGEYGNHVVLAMPIEQILRAGQAEPARASRSPRHAALLRSARPLAGPLTVSGLSRGTLGLLGRAARRAGRQLLAAPAGPLGGFPPQALVPGASVAATVASGDVALGGVGTVAYRDGARVWAFGHALDALGARGLFLEDAYVFGVIDNPIALPELGAGTFKLTSAGGHVQGGFRSDTISALAGSVGVAPTSIPLEVVARERGRDGAVSLDTRLADERSLGFGAGLSLVSPLGAGQALEQLLRDYAPATISMCFRVRVAERRRPLAFCNAYFDAFEPLDHLLQAGSLVDAFDLPPPRIERASISLRVRRGVRSDVLIGARLPRQVAPGQRVRARLTLQRRRGVRRTLRVPLRIPRDLRPGSRTLVLEGSGGGGFEEGFLFEFVQVLAGDPSGPQQPRSLNELARRLSDLHRDLGITARFRRDDERLVHRSDEVSYEGKLRVRLTVRRARR